MDEQQQNIPENMPNPQSSITITSDDKLFALLSHLSMFFLPVILPFVFILIKKDQSSFIYHHAKQALFWQLIYIVGMVVVGVVGSIFCFLILATIFLPIVCIVYAVIASIKSYNGEWYTYPLLDKFKN